MKLKNVKYVNNGGLNTISLMLTNIIQHLVDFCNVRGELFLRKTAESTDVNVVRSRLFSYTSAELYSATRL